MRLERPIAVIGTGRSGTTLIAEIVCRHRWLAWPSNYQARFPGLPSINAVRWCFDNPLWELVGQKQQLNETPVYNRFAFKPDECYAMWRHLTGPETDFSRDFLLDTRPSPERRDAIRRYFARMVAFQGRRRLAFKITGPPRIGYLMALFPDACFVHVSRDPLPTIASFLDVDFWQTRGLRQLWWRGAWSREEEAWAERHRDRPELLTALQIGKVRRVVADEVQRHSPRFLEIEFESFTARPREAVAQILDFAGLPADDRIDRYLGSLVIQRRGRGEKLPFDEATRADIHAVLEAVASDAPLPERT